MNLQEALVWVEDKCKFSNVRKRMKGREAAWVLYKEFHNLLELNKEIISENNKLKKENSNLRDLLK